MGKSLAKDKAGRLMDDSHIGFEIVPRVDYDDEDNKQHSKHNHHDNDEEHDWTDRDDDNDDEEEEEEEDDNVVNEYKRNALKNKLRSSADEKPSAESRVMTLALGTYI